MGLATLLHAAATNAQARSEAADGQDIRPGHTTTQHLAADQLRQADDEYLAGAKRFAQKKYELAQHDFERAVQLNPGDSTYKSALLLTREALITRNLQEAAQARGHGRLDQASALLEKARALDPTNSAVLQRFNAGQDWPHISSLKISTPTSVLAGPIEFEPDADRRSFHLRGDLKDVIRDVYGAFGIAVTFDPSVDPRTHVTFDLDDVSFDRATQILAKMSRTFGVPLERRRALVAKDTKESRDALTPWVEETIYLPGESPEHINEFATLARNVFDLKQVAVNTNARSIVLRGEEGVLTLLNDTYQGLVDDRGDVFLDVRLYEVDRTHTRNIGFQAPTTITAIDVASAAQTLISSNQTLLTQSIASGALSLSGSAYTQELQEVAFLVAAGVPGSSQFSGLLGTVGSYQGVPLAGISIGSATFNFLLNSSDVRTLDALQIRAHDGQSATFRVGSRYPVLTSLASASTSTATTAALEASGVSSAVATKLGGADTTTTVPQIQMEDLGMTLKITPSVGSNESVRLVMDLKLEALAGTGVDDIPILNSHALASTVTVLRGETTMLATLISTNETRAIEGIPELSDLPGFQSTDRSTDGTTNELLITVTPHIVRNGAESKDQEAIGSSPR